ncbi:ABC-2 transporter permease [Paenibacillus faecalis]|uniref:ABC-2 transporter permease n=1 Tax=Paenibacillus faecalis TaxID=2079532 RepID=UPI000D0F7D64|nr:ABC-2 transporter permease [Paenibacillus faecalis]
MYNLIRKDLILLKKPSMMLIPALLLYLYFDFSYIWSGFLFSIVIIMSLFSYDEKSSINTLLNSLPYTRKEIVSSKYIGALLFTLIIVFTIFIGNFLFHRELTAWRDILFIVGLVMGVTSLLLPFSYQFKSKYLMTGILVLFGVYMLVINTFIKNLNDIIREFVQTMLVTQNVQFYLIVTFSIMILYACSWLLSIHIYRKKAF